MASVIKKCGCPESAWGRCRHNWTVRYRDEAGRQREKSYKHDQKTLANALKTKAEHARMAGEAVYPDRCPYTFGEYAERTIRQSPVSQRSQKLYLGMLRNHLGTLAKRKLADVAQDRAGVTQLLRIAMPGSGLGLDSVIMAQIVITSTMRAAVENGDISGHRLAGIRLPRPVTDETVDPELIAKIDRNTVETIAGALPPRLALTVWLSYGCGLRVSEALGVRLPDFSAGMTTLTVARQVYNGNRTNPLKARDPGYTRTVPVPDWIAERIREHVSAYGTTDYLFPGQRTRFTPRTSLHRPWKRACMAAGIDMRFHDLRHAWCSRLISEGIPITEVAKTAGHRDSSITERIYHHMLPHYVDRMRDVLNKWI